MRTPIYDFLKSYSSSDAVRLHMPGHKGRGGAFSVDMDITEVKGADALYEADGIIKESEMNASELFGSHTFYSTEGSSLAIRAMLHLAICHGRSEGRKPLVLAGRNAHKVFISAAALIGFDIEWLLGGENYLSCTITAEEIERRLSTMEDLPCAVYLTSPDYLGNTVDIRKIADTCHKFGVLLLIDNAHGAYLKFLPESRHPIDLLADMCADSAHKTLPALTGAAYLHISKALPDYFKENAKSALSLYGSTSPSYLILASLDLANLWANKLCDALSMAKELREKLEKRGFELCGDEPLKLTVCPKSYGYTGVELSELLLEKGISCEFADPDYVVFMFSSASVALDFERLSRALLSIERRSCVIAPMPSPSLPLRAMSPREAIFSPSELIPLDDAEGRVLAAVSVGCPPAVPLVVSGEVIDSKAIEAMRYYGITKVSVIK